MKNDDYLTAEKLHNTMIHTHRVITGYDIDEVDELLDKCERVIRLQENIIAHLMLGIREKGLTIDDVYLAAQDKLDKKNN